MFMGIQSFVSDRTEARSQLFTEQEAFWNLPLHETSAIVDVAVTKGDDDDSSQFHPGQLGFLIMMAE